MRLHRYCYMIVMNIIFVISHAWADLRSCQGDKLVITQHLCNSYNTSMRFVSDL